MIRRREKTLGLAKGKRRYDLPLNRAAGTGFLVLLISLMTFLATLALAASFTLSAMTSRWSSGLENKVTVEIPATDDKGMMLKHEDVVAATTRIEALLKQNPNVADIHVLSDKEITDLVKPWLGDDLNLATVPVPGLITVQMKDSSDTNYSALAKRIAAVSPRAQLDTHEDWLKDILRFAGALQFAAALLTIVIGLTTATSVAGVVRARMAVNREEVEILHLMGASDTYISRQFQRHSLVLALQGSLAGTAGGGICLAIIGWISGRMEVNLVPGFSLQGQQLLILAALPLAITLLAVLTARHTVDRALAQLP